MAGVGLVLAVVAAVYALLMVSSQTQSPAQGCFTRT